MLEFIDTREAARLLAISPKTLEKLRTTGGGPPYHKVRRRVVYSPSDLEAWARSGRRRTTRERRVRHRSRRGSA